jgi:hypothetical protein
MHLTEEKIILKKVKHRKMTIGNNDVGMHECLIPGDPYKEAS